MFSADRFHPSSAGYARIAAALGPTVLAAAQARRDRDAAA
jgi:lysophospholipase L1-like esterase